MEWKQLNARAGVSALIAAIAVVTVIMPPFSLVMGLIGAVWGAGAWITSPEPSESRRIARIATLVSVAVVAILILGSVLYATLS